MCLYRDYGLLGRISEQNSALEELSGIQKEYWKNQSGSGHVVNFKQISKWLDRLKTQKLKAGEIKALGEEEQQELEQYERLTEQSWFDSRSNRPESWGELESRITDCEQLHGALVAKWCELTRRYRVRWEPRTKQSETNKEASGETEEEALQRKWFEITKQEVYPKVIASSHSWLARQNEGTGSFWGFVKNASTAKLSDLFRDEFGREVQKQTVTLPDENWLPSTPAGDEAVSGLNECIEKLPPEEKTVVEEFLRGKNLAQISREHGFSNVYSVFKRALEKLKRCLES